MNTEENDTEAELAAWELLREARLELAAVTEQREYWANLWADLARECVKDIAKVEREVVTLTQQRDGLAEAMTRIKNIYENPEKGCIPSSSDMYDEALQSLTPNARAMPPATESDHGKEIEKYSPSNAAACAPSYEGLGVWQIQTIRWEDDDRQVGKEWNATIVCKDIEVVWQLIESDRNDIRTEIRAINHIAHACAVIPFIPTNAKSAATGSERNENE